VASYALKTTRDAMTRAAQELERRKRVEDALKLAKAHMHALTEATQQSFVLIDTAMKVLSFNHLAAQNAYAVFGHDMHEDDSMYKFVLDRDRTQFTEDFHRALGGEIVTAEKSFQTAAGEERWFAFTYSPTHAENGAIIGICFTTVEITERRQADQALRKLSRAVEQSPASIVITDLDGMIEYVNPRFTQVTGYTFREAVGQNPRILKTDETPLGTHSDLWRTLSAGKEWRGEFVNRRKDGSIYYEAATISPIIDPDGVTTHYLAVKEDITERKRAEDALRVANEQLQLRVAEVERLQAELREQALHDPLTGLHNRRYLNETLDRELLRAERDGECLSLIVADIDHFKQLNDTYGHQAGDIFLVEIARLMKRHARSSDVICRYGGEEFLLVLPGASAATAEQRAEAIRRTCAEIRIPYAGVDLMATMSLGVATYPDHGRAADEIIMKADKALYSSKRDGRDRVTVWHEDRVLAG
jgi:diguanylate cyclase (GGDEF)-like protein/PAS domain S-box-containing protein